MKIFFNMLFRLFHRIKTLIFVQNYSVQQQSISLALGVYVAFCPFIGFHTLMMLLFTWLWSLNGPLMIGFSYIINNPWTMIPLYFFDHWIGSHIIPLLGLQALPEPYFMIHINDWLQAYFNSPGISGWAFLIGGNVVGLVMGLMTYFGAFLLLREYHKPLHRS
jgi:uncharacterized protein (DUF2062 family)